MENNLGSSESQTKNYHMTQQLQMQESQLKCQLPHRLHPATRPTNHSHSLLLSPYTPKPCPVEENPAPPPPAPVP